MNTYTFKYNRGDNHDYNYCYVNGLTYSVIAASEKEAFNSFYNFQNVDKFDPNVVFEFTDIKVSKLNPCGKLPHAGCFDCQDCPGPLH